MLNSKQVLDQLELFIRAVVRDAVRDEIPAQLPPMPTPPTNRVGGIQLAIAVTGLAKQTIYNMVSKRVIPHSVQPASGRLIFEEQTLREWMV